MSKDMHCLNCGQVIQSTGRNFEYVHANGYQECPPCFASPRLDFS